MIELNATEYKAFVSAGKLSAELKRGDALDGIKFPLVSQAAIDAMKSTLVVLLSLRPVMKEDQRYRHNNICEDVKHLVALKK